MNNRTLALSLCGLLAAAVLQVAPATSDLPEREPTELSGAATGPAATLGPLNPVEETPELKALKVELARVSATGDVARIKAVHNRIQAAYLAVQPRQVSDVKVEPVLEPPRGMADPGPDVLIVGGPVSTTGACYTMDGKMYAAAGLPDSSAVVLRSTNHGNSWQFLCGIRSSPNIIWPKVDVAVTEGDSAKIFLFALHTAGDGNAHVARFDTNGRNFLWFPVLAGPDTIGDFSFCADHDNWYYLYGCVYNTIRTTGVNGKMVRSTDFGRTWAATNDFAYLNQVNYQNGAGRWQYLATADRRTGLEGRINLVTNHNYGNPASWFEHDIRPDTFMIEEPVLCPAFTTPETAAIAWVAWHEINSTRPTPVTVLTAYSQDGCVNYSTPQPIASEAGAGDVWPDLQTYHDPGNAYINLSYISLYDGFRRVFRRYTNTGSPGTWSDTLRINTNPAYRSHRVKPRLVYSPGGPGSGAGCAFVSHSEETESFLWNAPWTGTVVAEPLPESEGVDVRLAPNPAHATLAVGWSGTCRTVAIYTADGRRVRVFDRPPANRLDWNLTDAAGRAVPSGVYIIRSSTDQGASVRQAIVQR